ncbi:MAG: hypothetical protein HY22_02050 [[Candidatus Thermochlorobacteriaceae] bacterium GBChlB]|nr:MAG: hypothetical protein HY22_02050 [[Candidatus Thermochlorobacteriaceae] bacterium GBChlB]
MKSIIFFFALCASISALAQPKPLVYDKPFPPAIAMSSFLGKGLSLENVSGRLAVQNLTVSFLPDKEEGGGEAKYGYEPTDHKLYAVLSQSGTDLAKFLFQTSGTEGPFTRCSILSGSTDTQKEYALDYTVTSGGEYLLSFFIDGKKFYDFPFSVLKKENADKFAEVKARYFLNGMWSDYGFLFFDPPNSAKGVRWVFFHEQQELETPTAVKYYYVDIELFKNGKLFGAGGTGNKGTRFYQPWRLESKRFWQREDLSLFTTGAGDKTGKTIMPADLADGKYEIRMTYYDTNEWQNGKPTKVVAGPFQKKGGADVFPFEVKGGKIQYQDRQVREKTPPEQFIEGGNSEWWTKRK